MGKDGDFGGAVELAPPVYEVERIEYGLTKSFGVFLVSSYPGLVHTSQEMNTIMGAEIGVYVNIIWGMVLQPW